MERLFDQYAEKNHHPDCFTSSPVLNETHIQNFSAKLSFAIHWHPMLLALKIL